jgi:hypothetical protein
MDRSSRFQWGPVDLVQVYRFKVIYHELGGDKVSLGEESVFECYEEDENAAERAFRKRFGEEWLIRAVVQQS